MGKMAMRSAGLDEATTYAWHKTGLLVSEENEDLLSGDDLEDWRALALRVLEVPLHSFRHFAATRMLAAGVPVRTVAGRLGHANAATTLNVYSQRIKESDQAAATILGDLLGNGDKAPTSPPSTGARRAARGAGTRPRSGPKGAPQ